MMPQAVEMSARTFFGSAAAMPGPSEVNRSRPAPFAMAFKYRLSPLVRDISGMR
jgi:hypothetical protein